MSENRPSNEDAPRVPGEESGGIPWGKIIIAAVALILLAVLVPLACQAFRGAGDASNPGDQGSSGGAEDTPDENGGASGTSGDEATGASVSSSSGEETTGGGTTGDGTTVASGDDEDGSATAQLSGAGYGISEDGESVTVPRATLSGAGGWLAVRADDGGEPGEILGYAPLDEGDNTEVEVEFDRPLADTQKLYAVVHAEEPADGDLTFPDGDPPLAQNGDIVSEEIQYTATDGPVASDDVEGVPEESLADTGGPPLALFVGALTALLLGGLLSLYLRGKRLG